MERPNRSDSDVPTITDVARHAGVSPMTVSRVMNSSGNVQPAKREKVLQAVEELYRDLSPPS